MKPKFFFPLFRQGTLAGLIFVLGWLLYTLISEYQPVQKVKLPSSDAPVELYSNQTRDDLTRLYTEAIAHAHQSITLVIYALADSHIIHALQEASEREIALTIVCDAEASPGISHYLPKATIVKHYGNGLMHQKILIIDDTYVLLGSANLTYSSLNMHGNLVLGIDNKWLAEALDKRAKSMNEEGGHITLLHKETMAGTQALELWVLPDDRAAVERMLSLFRSAQKSIKIAIFTWTRSDFAEELIAAKKRGVQVEVVIDRSAGKGAGSKIVRMLEQGGVPVRLSTGNKLLHHKFTYIDDSLLVNGSANWTKAAFDENHDIFVILYPLKEDQREKMDRLWKVIVKESEIPTTQPPKAIAKKIKKELKKKTQVKQ